MARVQSLVGELRSHKWHSQKTNKQTSKQKIKIVGEDVEKLAPLCIAGGNNAVAEKDSIDSSSEN